MHKLTKINREKKTIEFMIRFYCKHKEKNNELCPQCRSLIEYAHKRLDHCPFGDNKTSCKKCTIHCYAADRKKLIKQIMRYSGPWMLIYAPIQSIKHLLGK